MECNLCEQEKNTFAIVFQNIKKNKEVNLRICIECFRNQRGNFMKLGFGDFYSGVERYMIGAMKQADNALGGKNATVVGVHLAYKDLTQNQEDKSIEQRQNELESKMEEHEKLLSNALDDISSKLGHIVEFIKKGNPNESNETTGRNS